jgi:hypothetical protein
MVVPEVVVRALDGPVVATGRTAVDPDGASVERTPDLNDTPDLNLRSGVEGSVGRRWARRIIGRTSSDAPNYRE